MYKKCCNVAGISKVTICGLSFILIRGTVNDCSKLKCLNERDHLQETASVLLSLPIVACCGRGLGLQGLQSIGVRSLVSGLKTA